MCILASEIQMAAEWPPLLIPIRLTSRTNFIKSKSLCAFPWLFGRRPARTSAQWLKLLQDFTFIVQSQHKATFDEHGKQQCEPICMECLEGIQ